MANARINAWYERKIILSIKHTAKPYNEFITNCEVFFDYDNNIHVKVNVDDDKYVAFLLYSSIDKFKYKVEEELEGIHITSVEVV